MLDIFSLNYHKSLIKQVLVYLHSAGKKTEVHRVSVIYLESHSWSILDWGYVQRQSDSKANVLKYYAILPPH